MTHHARACSTELRDRIAADPVLVARLAAIAQLARATTPTEFAGMIEDQRAKIADIVRRTGMKQ